MGTFDAGLRTIGDVKALPATIELSDGQLSIAAGSTEIGSWPLDEIHLEEIPTGYRMAAEGEQILIELNDVDSFAAELASWSRRRLGFGRKKKPIPTKTDRAVAEAQEPTHREPPSAPVSVDPEPQPQAPPPPSEESDRGVRSRKGKKNKKKSRPRKSKPKAEKSKRTTSGWTEKGLYFVDGNLNRARKRFGSFLPEWVFTRAMFFIAFAALILLVVLPGLVSVFLLISGGLLILFGAVTYSDSVLASRWLPGRTTSQHVLLFGVAVLMMGVLFGVVAN